MGRVPTESAAQSSWLRDAPIATKLKLIVAVFVVNLSIFYGISALVLEVSESVRAYIVAEGLWSKGQKDAVIALADYVGTGDEGKYREYLRRISIPLGYKQARLELQKPDFNPEIADDGFRKGGVESEEARSDMIFLFRCCHDIPFFAEAIEIWTEGDAQIALLMAEVEEVHARITAGTADSAYRIQVRQGIEDINTRLTVLENKFSFVIGNGADQVHDASLWLIFLSAVFLLLVALLLSAKIARQMQVATQSLSEGMDRVGAGDLTWQIPVLSRDELGSLAATFNEMIVHRQTTDAALEKERVFLKSLLDSLSEGVAACDEQGRLTFFNRALNEMIGEADPSLSPAEWPTRYSVYLLDGETPAPTEQLPLVRALRGEVVKDEELVIRRENRPPRTILCSGRLITTGQDQKRGAVLAVRDVTDSRHAEQRFRRIVETAPNAMVMVNDKGRIALVNAQAERLFGYARDELLGQLVEILVPWNFREHHPGLREGYYRNPQQRTMGHGRELYALTKTRREVPVEIGLSPLQTPDGIFVMASIVDISERKRAESELKKQAAALLKSNEELERYAFVAAHDLQEPLRTITSYTQWLVQEYGDKDSPETGTLVRHIVDATHRMRDQIQGLLEYSRVSQGAHVPTETDLNQTLKNALANLEESIRDCAAVITHDRLPVLAVDEPLITQLLQNLIGNALKFRGQDAPRIHVGASPEGAGWVFSVADNGIGIDPKHVERVFVLYQRLHTREVYPGNGLGLALCKKIVERHGGRIWVEAGNPGSVFRFTLAPGPIAAMHKFS